jgi:hypothetical protein
MAYLASRVGVIRFVGVAIVVLADSILADSSYRGVYSIHQLCKRLANSPSDFLPLPSSTEPYPFSKILTYIIEGGRTNLAWRVFRLKIYDSGYDHSDDLEPEMGA